MFSAEIILIAVFKIQLLLSARYYVDPDAPDYGVGSSWNTAFNTLDAALSSALGNGDEIFLKGNSTYYPQTNTRTDCFVANDGITIYGGFFGHENGKNGRLSNINNRPKSIISGDIGTKNDISDNCYHVLQYTKSLSLDCVVIEGGNANYNGDDLSRTLDKYGGGLITSNIAATTNLELQHVIIRNNTALNGGGLFVSSNDINQVNVIIQDSSFMHNRAIDGQFEGGYGGAIYEVFITYSYTKYNLLFIAMNI